jgi:hypothetical protein
VGLDEVDCLAVSDITKIVKNLDNSVPEQWCKFTGHALKKLFVVILSLMAAQRSRAILIF